MHYLFVLGRNQDLSIAELKSVFRQEALPYKLIQSSKEIALVESKDDLDIQILNKTLGGIVKIGRVIKEVPLEEKLKNIFSNDILVELFGDCTGKIEFGISLYSCGGASEQINKLFLSLEDACRAIKSKLEEAGIKSHYPQSKEKFLSSASVDKNNLLKNGGEILIVATQNSLLVGKTLAVQEFEKFSKRDYGRPVRDMHSGVMPPKLARIMINLAQIGKKDVLLDPFCGSGTILQESLILGYRNVLGRDNSQKAIDDTKTNLDWLTNNTQIANTVIDVKLGDTTRLLENIRVDSINAIVSEPYLGPTLKNRLHISEISKTLVELKNLYLLSFEQFHKVLKQNGVVVIILPAFPNYQKTIYMEIISDIESLGFKQILLSQGHRKSIIVGTRNDFVLREIVKFEKS